MSHVFLYGAPASGKTTLGGKLAEALGLRHVDLDAAVVAKAGKPIATIFAESGEAAFRELERCVLAETIGENAATDMVISLGGGTLLSDANRALCEHAGEVFCLEPPDEAELERRIVAAGKSRPLGNRAAERATHYASFARRIIAFFESAGSLVIVGNGVARMALERFPRVVDGNVNRLYAAAHDAFGRPLHVIPSGEEHKTPTTVASLWHAFAAAGLGRRDVVAALGGGVTGDLTGFAAATWMRGMAWVNVPTTLLSMVDASTGGKTGCDLPEGKNLAGAFHSPRLVLIDVDFLKTLPPDVLSAGRAEMVKHEVIGALVPEGASADIPTAAEIAANLMVKAKIVDDDPLERLGRRILLNCGHTVAHALEKATEYRLSHGEAVAIGCVAEARLAVALGLAGREWPAELAARLAGFRLPVSLPEGVTLENLRPHMIGDKKRAGNVVTFALPCGWGDVRAIPIDLSHGFSSC